MEPVQEAQVVDTKKPEELFVEEYNALCKKHGLQIVALPQYVRRDDNTFSLVVNMSVAKI